MVSKRAQAWGFDLMAAGMIFLAGIIIFYVYSLNYPKEGQEKIDLILYDGDFIADNLLSQGYPPDWNTSDVIKIGISSDNRINQTKLDRLYNLTTSPGGYNVTKAIFGTGFDYFFNFTDQMTAGGSPVQGIGLAPPAEADYLIRIERVTVYKGRPSVLNVYIWE